MNEGACIEDVVLNGARWHVAHCDNLFALQGMPDGCVDAVVCDPPYELAFMGRRWDASGVAYDVQRWREVLRVLKPGGHLLAFGGTRTYHRMACAIEDAGFDIRDSLHWFYASGFPKSLDVSKAIDAAAGAERMVVGPNPTWREAKRTNAIMGPVRGGSAEVITAPATDAAREWSGWGTALKPAHEPIVVARKPLAGTVAANVLARGTGGLNVDGCRVEGPPSAGGSVSGATALGQGSGWNAHENRITAIDRTMPSGRWPANIIFSHAPTCTETTCDPVCPVAELDQQSGVLTSGSGAKKVTSAGGDLGYAPNTYGKESRPVGTAMISYGDSGGASRFFHCFRFEAKASTAEREAGLDALPVKTAGELTGRVDGTDGLQSPRAGAGRASHGRRNIHPTVKPIALMRWLCKLVTPPGGIVLDPYAGSGTTGIGAVLEGFRFVGIEGGAMCGGFGKDRVPHIEIARARIRHCIGGNYEAKEAPEEATLPRQRSLF